MVDIIWHHVVCRVYHLNEQQPGQSSHDVTVEPLTNYTDGQSMIAGELINILIIIILLEFVTGTDNINESTTYSYSPRY